MLDTVVSVLIALFCRTILMALHFCNRHTKEIIQYWLICRVGCIKINKQLRLYHKKPYKLVLQERKLYVPEARSEPMNMTTAKVLVYNIFILHFFYLEINHYYVFTACYYFQEFSEILV